MPTIGDWNSLSDEELLALCKQSTSKADLARKLGLRVCTQSLRARLATLPHGLADQKNHMAISKDDFIQAVNQSSSVLEVIRNLELREDQNVRYRQVHTLAAKYEVALPEYDRARGNQALGRRKRMPDDEYFVSPSDRAGTSLRHRMVEAGVPYRCAIEECQFHAGPIMWCGKPIVLTVDHINGKHMDNRLENLRFLCSLCHSQTDTFTNRKPNSHRRVCECGRNVYASIKTCPHEVVPG